MSKTLVIVESPAKAKTINKYLGKDFVVKSSVGHIRDLPTSGGGDAEKTKAAAAKTKAAKVDPKKKEREKLFKRMGINPEKGWEPRYEILPGKEKVIKELKDAAAKADAIYLASDLDREGEAIAWHLKEVIGGDDSRFKRVVFNEITKKAIQDAFSHPVQLNMDRVNAQQTRRFLDRVVGFMVSPLLWKKVARGLSAGRVQSVAVRLLVDKEREIRAFIPEEYWDIHALCDAKAGQLNLEVAKEGGKEFRPGNEKAAMAAVEKLKKAQYKVAKREDKPTRSNPNAPFITSTLQQAASTRLNFSVKKTMTLAQRLYEAGFITYMRTDSTNLSDDALSSVRGFIEKEFGSKYLPKNPNVYSSKEGAQEAHEAIRPTSVEQMPGKLAGIEEDGQKLYQLIWRQFVACQMTSAEYDSTSITVQAENFELRTRGRVLRFDGWTRVLPPQKKSDEDVELPDVKEGEVLKLDTLTPKQHFTKPPGRYTEASLVKELEKRGIGRPSTYAAIISTIQDRGYASVKQRRFYAEKMGEIVTDRLVESFTDLLDFNFTAQMEEQLDEIAEGDANWKQALDKFYQDFVAKLEAAENEKGGMRWSQPVETDIKCPDCGRPMAIRTATTGVFLGCTGFNLPPKERCKKTINLISADEVVSTEDEEAEVIELRAKKRCTKCGSAMSAYVIDENRKLHVCGNNPECDGYIVEQGQFRLKGYDGPIIQCEKCGSDMQLKVGRFGKYFGCTNDECKNTRKLLRSGQAAPPREDPIPMPHLQCDKHPEDTYILRDGAAGLFLAASKFPKIRETRPPKIAELRTVKSQLAKKFHYLLEAPDADPEGNPTVLRYSRKSGQQFVASEKEGKQTNWSLFYVDGKWQERGDGDEAATAKTKASSSTSSKTASKAPVRKKA
ncbi:type I DNA topoisomerase [Permianibacter aggregans]|uniref:DNA topoisomerase 1 n=1 Tax=Permianibacter aggregans TaxID=1510150 RepID=A0A4R6UCY6_9GAMM|nr:type I DNA topoisomerase [Permianibacter aggregans]TDQ44531.1 DNA topoisomerase I [Permianibacter aggregans]